MTATLTLLTPLEAQTCPSHHSRLRPNGTCAGCELGKSVAFQAMCEAQSRLDDGEFLLSEKDKLQAIADAYWTCQRTAERDAKTAPNGCAVCGLEERGHGVWEGGGHNGIVGRTYIEPSNVKRLDRMLARRAYRAGTPNAAVDRLFARAIPACGTCRKRPATLAAECRTCFSLSLDLDSRYER